MKVSKELRKQIQLLESITGKRVRLVENTEAMKNLATESLKRIADTLDLLKQDLALANEKVNELSGIDTIKTKLDGIDSIVDTVTTDVAEMIALITGSASEEDSLTEADEAGIEVSMDKAVEEIDNVKKIAEKGVNVIIDPEK